MSSGRQIRLVEGDDGAWAAIDEDAGVTERGETRREALESLDEAVALHNGTDGTPMEGEEALLRDMGIDPEDLGDTRALPDFMKSS